MNIDNKKRWCTVMLNYMWGIMIIIGIVVGALTGNMEAVSAAIIDSSKEAISLCITMLGIVSMWTGVLKIAEVGGLMAAMARFLSPVINFLFPRIPKDHPAREYISTNFVANILGLGWAATPAGLKAMEELQKLNKNKGLATTEMCTFLIINISSLQLIPMNIIAYRSEYGSVSPTAIIVPAILATAISTLAGVIYAKIMERRYHE